MIPQHYNHYSTTMVGINTSIYSHHNQQYYNHNQNNNPNNTTFHNTSNIVTFKNFNNNVNNSHTKYYNQNINYNNSFSLDNHMNTSITSTTTTTQYKTINGGIKKSYTNQFKSTGLYNIGGYNSNSYQHSSAYSNNNNGSKVIKRRLITVSQIESNIQNFFQDKQKKPIEDEPKFFKQVDREVPILMKEYIGVEQPDNSPLHSTPSIYPILKEYLKDFSIYYEEKSKSFDKNEKTSWQERAEALFAFILKLPNFDYKIHRKQLIQILNRSKSNSETELESIINNYFSIFKFNNNNNDKSI